MKEWTAKELIEHFKNPNHCTQLNKYSAAHCADYYVSGLISSYQNMIDSGHDMEREYYHYRNVKVDIQKYL